MAGLSISRKKGETFYIGDDISITVTRLDRYQVHLAIVAPREVPIMREEIACGRPNRDQTAKD